MLNRYFDTNGNIDFVYANIAIKNINFALISLHYILDVPDFDIALYRDEHTYYFFHIQSVLTACGNISNIFYNYGGYGGIIATARSQRLRATFNVSRSKYPLIFQKEVRNTNAHFDERYEQFNGNIGDYNILDKNTDLRMRRIIMKNPHLRTYDKEKGIYYTYNRELKQITYDLYRLRDELNELLYEINYNPVSNAAWIDSMPDEKVEKS